MRILYLKQYGMKATAFIVTSRIKRHPQKWNPQSLQFMSVSELNEMSAMFLISSHIPIFCIGLMAIADPYY